MRVLVVGGSGFVGGAIVRSLLSGGHSVTLLNRGRKLIHDTRQIFADRNCPSQLARGLQGVAFDAVIDTNCYTGIQAKHLIDALEGRVRSALIISSAAVYLDGVRHPPTENEPIGGGSAWAEYGQGKSDVENAYLGSSFATVMILRPPYIFGPNNDLDREAWFFRRILYGRPVLVPGSGASEYQFLHEDDLGRAVDLCLMAPLGGKISYNIADPDWLTSAGFVQLLGEVASLDVDIRLVGKAAGSSRPRDWFPFRDVHCRVDTTAFIERFEWRPAYGLRERLSQVFAHLTASGRLSTDDWTPLESDILSRVELLEEGEL